MSEFPEDIFQNILNNPEAMKTIGSMLSSLQGNGTENKDAEKGDKKEEQVKKDDPFLGFLDNPEMLFKIGNMYKQISSEDDTRVNLLMALKPYLSEKRAERVDGAVKILKLSKMSSVLGDLNIF